MGSRGDEASHSPRARLPAAARVEHQGRIPARSHSLESAREVRMRSGDRDLGQPASRVQPGTLLEGEGVQVPCNINLTHGLELRRFFWFVG